MIRAPSRRRLRASGLPNKTLNIVLLKTFSVRTALLKQMNVSETNDIIQRGHQLEIQLLRLNEQRKISTRQAQNVTAFIRNYMIQKKESPSWADLKVAFPFLSPHTRDSFEFGSP